MTKSETVVKQDIVLDGARLGLQLWRNNVGACEDKYGNHVRYGLANLSRKMNKSIKSSDLIGFTPVQITQDMVGQTVAVFTAVETKHSDWIYDPRDPHTEAQEKYINLVRAAGGMSGFARTLEDFHQIIGLTK